jgi:ABC-type transport system substrate-binding protein
VQSIIQRDLGQIGIKLDIQNYSNSTFFNSFYCNPALDKLFVQEQATVDSGVRQQLFDQIHRIYLTQFPFIVLYGPIAFALVHKGTHNYLPGPFTDTYNIAEWWCDNGKC